MANVKELKINEQIKAHTVRLIDSNGVDLGIIALNRALEIAGEQELDLIEVSPNEQLPVCKLGDFGKLVYNEQKRKAKTRTRTSTLKEVQLTPNISPHDLELKVKKIKEFLVDGDKVKINMRFRGRECDHVNEGQEKFDNILEVLGEIVKIESKAKFEGRQMIMVLAPISKNS